MGFPEFGIVIYEDVTTVIKSRYIMNNILVIIVFLYNKTIIRKKIVKKISEISKLVHGIG